MRRLILSSLFILVFAGILYSASGTPSTLIVRTDANNYLLVTSATQTNPVTQGVFSSRTLRTDSSGNLQVILTGTVTPTYPMSVPASTCAAPSLGESGAATTGIAFTATPSILNCISGTARTTLTATGFTSTVPITQTLGTITTSAPATLTQTWNAGGVTFIASQIAITNTASAGASRAFNVLGGAAGATELFYVRADGTVVVGQSSIAAVGFNSTAGSSIQLSGISVDIATAPTIASGGCTNPAIQTNGTAGQLVTIGTSCAGIKTIVLTFPAAAHFWACSGNNNTSDAAQQTNYPTFRATSTTSVTLTSYDRVLGVPEDFTASDTYLFACRAE